MKAYMFYLSIPENIEYLKDIYPEEMVDDFNTYIKSSLNSLTKRISDISNKWMYLYGITDKKEYADLFESFHDMKLFKRIEKKVTKEEYESLRQNNVSAVIDWRSLDNSYFEGTDPECSVICPKCELFDITDTIPSYLNEILMESSCMEYIQFKDEFIEALDKLLYCTNNRLNSEDSEYYEYNYSYGVTAEGYGYRIKYTNNALRLYMKLYGLLLRKSWE